MSTPPPATETPVQPDSVDNYKDAKAAAKAAQAFAKAQRPWYKRKRYIAPLGLVVLMMAVSAGSSGGGAERASSEPASSASASSSAGSSSKGSSGTTASVSKESKSDDDGVSGNVREPLTNAGTTYEVTDVKVTDTIGESFTEERADGTFVVVGLDLTNNKDETKMFSESMASIQTADGKQYESSSKGIMAVEDSLMLKEIQPDLTTSGQIVFELPPNKVSGSTLVIKDLWGSGEIKVDLGL